MREFSRGVGYLLGGFGWWRRRPGAMLLGLVPAAIVGILLTAALVALGVSLPVVTSAITPFAEGWIPAWRDFLRLAIGTAFFGGALIIAIVSFTALTLVVGDPFYERVWRRVETDLGGAVPDGVRALVITDTSDGKTPLRTLDLMSEFNTWHGRDPDPRKAFRAALRRSLASSVREGQLFEHSATRDLSAGPWVWVAPNDDGAKVDALSPASKAWLHQFADLYGGNVRLLRSQHATGGAWVIDPTSGSITAVDANGRGGATCKVPDDSALLVALTLLSLACFVKAPAAGSQGFLLCLGADTYGAVATAAASYDNPAPAIDGPAMAALLYGAQLLGAANLATGPDAALARGLYGVILAMLSVWTSVCSDS
jgi:hypothetical protein